MRRKDIAVLILISAIAAVLSVFVLLTAKNAEMVLDTDGLACEELTGTMDNQRTFFTKMLNEKFSVLESLSYYLGLIDDLDFPSERACCDAVMLASHFNSVCLADLDGNTVSNDGAELPNVSQERWFKEANSWIGVRSVQFYESSGADGHSAMIISVPLRHRNILTGILYADIDLNDLDNVLTADNFNGGEAVFITDSDGDVILRNKNAYDIERGSNLFSGYLSDLGTPIRSESVLPASDSRSGCSMISSHGVREYVAYSALDVEDWYIFSVVSEHALAQKYAGYNRTFSGTIRVLMGAFFILAVCSTATVMYFTHRYYWTGTKLRRKDLVLEANDAFVYSDTALPIKKLRFSHIAEQMAEHAYGSGSVITSILRDGKVRPYFISIGILETLGYTEEEFSDILENDVSQIIHPDDLAATVETNLRYTNVGDSFCITVRYRKKNGEYLWINEYSHIFMLNDGTSVCASQFVDITKEKELEQQLRDREETYKIAASMSKYAVLRYDVSSRTMTVLSRGSSPKQLDNVLDNVPEKAIEQGFVTPESAEAARKVFSEIETGAVSSGRTVLALISDRETRSWVEVMYYVVGGTKDGKPEAAILSCVDVTEKRLAEEFINIGSAFMDYATDAKLIIANLSEGVVEYEAPGTLHRSFTEITGSTDIKAIFDYAARYAVAPDYTDIFTDFLSVERLIKEYEKGNREEGLDCRIISTSGSEKWVNLQIRLAKDSFSGDIKAYLVLKDIDTQKNLEKELQLEKRQAEKTERSLTETDNAEFTAETEAEDGVKQVFARTFGYFDLFVDGKPLHFTNPKEKELLAILIDRNGGTLSAEEAISILWEDEPFGDKQLSRYRKLASRLKSTLTEAGCQDIVITSHGVRHIDVSKIECDYYEVLSSNSKFVKLYQGMYMLNYSWAEETTAALNRLLLFREENP